jgi:hypothetical protein
MRGDLLLDGFAGQPEGRDRKGLGEIRVRSEDAQQNVFRIDLANAEAGSFVAGEKDASASVGRVALEHARQVSSLAAFGKRLDGPDAAGQLFNLAGAGDAVADVETIYRPYVGMAPEIDKKTAGGGAFDVVIAMAFIELPDGGIGGEDDPADIQTAECGGIADIRVGLVAGGMVFHPELPTIGKPPRTQGVGHSLDSFAKVRAQILEPELRLLLASIEQPYAVGRDQALISAR